MYCASEAVHLHAKRSPSVVRWVVGGTWRLGSYSLRPELPNGLLYQDRAFEQQLLRVFNHRFHKKTDMSHTTHTSLISLAARRHASSPSGAYKRNGTHPIRRDTPRASRCKYVLDGTCAQVC